MSNYKYFVVETFALSSVSSVLLKTLGVVGAFLVGFFGHIYDFLLVTGSLVMLDFVTGAWKASRAGRKLTSGGMKRSVEKTLLYMLAIIASYIVESAFVTDWQGDWKYSLTYIVSGFISGTELKSILENVGEALGIDIWGRVKDAVGNLFNRNQNDRGV